MIRFSCTNCGNALSAPDGFEGKTSRCRNCKQALTVPELGPIPKSATLQQAPASRLRILSKATGFIARGALTHKRAAVGVLCFYLLSLFCCAGATWFVVFELTARRENDIAEDAVRQE